MDVYVIGSSLTLDDLCQLQSLLSYEHQKREKYVDHHNRHHHHQPIHFRHAMAPAVAQREQERLQIALEHLKVLKEQYRKQRTLQIQAYLENYRRQELIRAVLLEEEERYYRQCISAALEQKRVNSIFNQYILQQQIQQQQQPEEVKERFLQNKREETTPKQQEETIDNDEKEEKRYSEYHSQQLAELLKQIFNHQPVYDNNEDDTEKDMADVWQIVSNIPGNEKLSYQFDLPKTEHGTPPKAVHSTTSNSVTSYDNQCERSYDKDSQSLESLQENMEQTQIRKKKEEEIKENKNEETCANSDESDTESLPPLQDHVLTLQDLIKKLSSEPVMVGEQYIAPEPVKKNYFQHPGTNTLQTSDNQIPKYLVDQSELEPRDDESPVTFMPQNIITDAEPTPTIEQPINDVDKEFSDFVDAVAAKQKEDLSSISADSSQDEGLSNSRNAAKSDISYQSENSREVPMTKPESQQQKKTRAQDQANINERILNKDQSIEERRLPKILEPSTDSGIEDILDKETKERIPANFSVLEGSLNSATIKLGGDTVQERNPAKQHLYEKLDQIENQLNSGDMKSRSENVLKSNLTFSKQNGGTLLLSTSTQADREFLGLEDELMRIMLKLDGIDSDGDEAIRNYRRTLVKRCQAMLDKLDQHKQKEWEKAVGNKHQHSHHSHKNKD